MFTSLRAFCLPLRFIIPVGFKLLRNIMTAYGGPRQPGDYDVLCARGKAARDHAGNVRFRGLVSQSLDAYRDAVTKIDKSLVVSSIVNQVREYGDFLKEDDDTSGWYIVDDAVAREKVGQSLRDLLHGKYKSSTKAKRIRRREKQNALSIDLEQLMASDQLVASKMNQLFDTRDIQPEASDKVEAVFTKANSQLLEAFKKKTQLESENAVDSTFGNSNSNPKESAKTAAASKTKNDMANIFDPIPVSYSEKGQSPSRKKAAARDESKGDKHVTWAQSRIDSLRNMQQQHQTGNSSGRIASFPTTATSSEAV